MQIIRSPTTLSHIVLLPAGPHHNPHPPAQLSANSKYPTTLIRLQKGRPVGEDDAALLDVGLLGRSDWIGRNVGRDVRVEENVGARCEQEGLLHLAIRVA
jgi:hypothetical protein